ncbi:MAG: co-chaperone GroES [Chlamydiales bacterium]
MATQQEAEKKKNSTSPNFKPLGSRVLVRRLEAEETLKGGIILPDTAKKKQEKAEVLALGTGKKDKQGNTIPIPVNVGDIVLMDKYSGQDITIDEVEYVIVRADDIIAIIE